MIEELANYMGDELREQNTLSLFGCRLAALAM